jgi:hypothetical protein
MQEFEKLGQFYLGRKHNTSTGRMKEDLVMYDSKDLVTHGVCAGMTGSGKTGLCIALLEEAAIDNIPGLVAALENIGRRDPTRLPLGRGSV